MRPLWLCLTLLLVAAGPPAAGPPAPGVADPERLRALARMPPAALEWNLFFDDQMTIALPGDPGEWLAQTVALRASLRNDGADAARHFRLGELYDQLTRAEQAKQGQRWHLRRWGSIYRDPAQQLAGLREMQRLARDAYARSAELYRFQLERHPNERGLLFQRNQALDGAGSHADASRVLRALAQESPQDWRYWLALGRCAERYYEEYARQADEREAKYSKADRVAWSLAGRRPADVRLADAQPFWNEAREYYDRAVRSAPNQPQLYLYRARFHFSRVLRGENNHETIAAAGRPMGRLTPGILDDVRAAARLDPDNVRLLVTVAVLQLWELPDRSRADVSAVTTRLQAIAGGEDVAAAAAAWEGWALLQWLVRPDSAQLAAALRQAVTLQSRRALNWELLAACYRETQRFEEAAAAAVELVRLTDAPRHRLVLAQAYCDLERFDRAEDQVRAALLLDPFDFHANLFLAVLLMKHIDDPAALPGALAYLEQARQRLDKQSPPEEQHAYTLMRAIHAALAGNLRVAEGEWQKAKKYTVDPKWDREVHQALAWR